MRVACLYFTRPVALHEFAQACLRFSPQISVREPNVIFIEIGKCLLLYTEPSFVARTQVLLRRFKTEATIAISSDIPSALALSHFGAQKSSSAPPDSAAIDRLPIQALEDFGDPFRSDPMGREAMLKMIESLTRLGIKTIAQFRTIPSSQLPSRFGGLGLYCRQRIEGGVDLPWPHWEPPATYCENLELEPSEYCADLEPLLFQGKECLDRLFSRLRGKFLRAEKIQVRLHLEKDSTVKKPLRQWDFEFISPQGSTIGFLPILRERLNWDLQKEPIESFVIRLECEATSTVIGNESQRNFFHSRDDFDEAMGSLFGQLEAFLGPEHVFWARVTERRYPEKSWDKTKDASAPQAVLMGRYPLRPSRLFKKPVSITVMTDTQNRQDRISLKGRVYKVLRWSSVERLALDWLDDCPARNYYRVDLEGGRSLFVYTDPGHHYFAHGYFE